MAYLDHFGAYLPPRRVDNEEIARLTGKDPAWILSVSGIEERRFAAPQESVEDLATAAAKDCLERAGLSPHELGAVVMASGTSRRRFPGPAAAVAARLGLNETPAFDIPIASAGALVSIVLADSLAERLGNVLVVAAEKMSEPALATPLDPNVAILFGDGAGACLVRRSSGKARIRDWLLGCDGNFSDHLKLDFQGPVQMDGRSVILQAVRKLPRAIRTLLERNQIPPSAVGAYLLHQANQNLLDQVARILDVPPERFFSNIRRCGNTSSASVLIAAAEWSNSAGFRPGSPVVLAAFGAGFHWGALLAAAD